MMKKRIQFFFGSIALLGMSACSNSYVKPDAPIKEVPFTQVHLNDNFWTPRIETNRTVSIPSAFKECEKNGRFDNFAIAGGLMKGEHRGDFSFDDTDPYKIIEGASYSLAVKYDKALDAYLDSVITLIAAAQEPDGYLTTCVTNKCYRLSGWWGKSRWEKINSHELYNSGHLYEAAVAHYRATGKRSLLDVAIKNADLVCQVFGPGEGQKHVPSGHPIVEMALAKLYKVTGDDMYSVNNGQWVTMQSGINRISFNDMTPGTYKFSIKAKDYTFYSEPKNFIVNISPAWYASNWAKGVYLLIALTIIYIIGAQIRHRYQVHRKLLEHIHAEEINEAKLQFFINISHEIRTPVTLILSPLQKLMSKDRNEERQKNYQTISRNAGRLLQLVNQLLDIRKLDKGQMQLKFREVEIVEFIRNLSSSFEYQANAKKISLNFHPDTEELRAWIDPENLDKAIFNVLSNAFKFTESGGEINIYLQTHEAYETKPAYFKIVIEDSGTGIDEKEIERIFDRFYQVANRLNNSGTGIGLHLTKSLVELHKGTIHAENNKEKAGCRFIIRLPLGKEHLKPEEIEETNTEGQIASDNNPVLPIFLPENEEKERIRTKTKYRILIADDNEEIRRYIRQELTPDYHITECNNGQEAFEQIIKDAPDALISDVMMPEMDGMTLCRKIRQNILVSHIPVILLTAKINEESNLEALEGGVDAYITKPFNIDVLKKTIRNVIYRHELIKNTFNGSMEQTDKVQPIEVQSPDEKLIARVMAIINKEMANPNLSVEMIAAEAGISRVHLYRKIKEFTNQSPRNFIRNVRLKQAALLLAQKHHNITEVAEAVGFANTTHFSTAFKELFGVSPTIYMEQSANNAKSNIVDTMEKNKVE